MHLQKYKHPQPRLSLHQGLQPPTKKQSTDSGTSTAQESIISTASTSGVVMLQKKPPPPSHSVKPQEEERSSVTYEEASSDEEEEESVSVTTGRLSLTLSHSSDKDGAIDVTAATVQKEEIQTELTPRIKTPTGVKTHTSGSRSHASVTRPTDIRHIAQLEEASASQKSDDPQSKDEIEVNAAGADSREVLLISDVGGNVDEEYASALVTGVSEAAPEADSEEGEVQKNVKDTGQPPVKKASSIIGKAIAKAMARESTVKEGGREGSPGLYSPVSSRGSTPASLTHDSTAASSLLDSGDSTPGSTTPMSTTPRSTPDLTEEANSTMQVTADSEDEDLLRSLDTIPEEEEISERTESGRLLSRSSARNIKLPFNPTSVVRLGTPIALQTKDRPPAQEQVPQESDSKLEPVSTTNNDAPPAVGAAAAVVIAAVIASSDIAIQDATSDHNVEVDSDQYQDTRLSEKSDDVREEDDSDSSTPHQVENDEDNSLAMIPLPAEDSNQNENLDEDAIEDTEGLYVAEEFSAAQRSHQYYNTSGLAPGATNTYYNNSAAVALAQQQDKIKIDPNDYESMYSIKRELDLLRDASSEMSDKIETLGTRNRKKGPLKDAKPTKELKSVLKQSASHSSLDARKKQASDSVSSPVSGAQLLAEENINTVKRSPKGSNLSKSATAPAVNEEPGISAKEGEKLLIEAVPTASTATSSAKSNTGKLKTKLKKKTESDYSSSDQTDASKSNEDATVIQNENPDTSGTFIAATTPTSIVTTTTKSGETKQIPTSPEVIPKQEIPKSSSIPEQPLASSSNILQVKPKTTIHSVLKKGDLRSSGSTGSSAFSPPSTSKRVSSRSRGTIDSSGESEDEDKIMLSQRVSLERSQLLPNLLNKLEGLKGREPNYQEVQDLKLQITDLKRSLQAQMSEEDREGLSPLPRLRVPSRTGTPTITVDAAPSDGADSPGLLKPRTEEESTQYEQLRFDRTVRRLLAEGQAGSYEKAELAAHLLSLSFDEDDSIAAAQECSSIYGALHFLQQDCELCAEKFPMRNMVSMLYCTHRCCIDCAKTYFTYQIKTKNIREMRCPFCNEPNLDSTEVLETMGEYFNHLDILLKGIVDEETHELFQRKLRDLSLMSDPNFRWCNKCSSGFIANPRARKLICPDCKDVTCAHCRLPWEAQHEGISCGAFATWKQENDPEAQALGVAKHLAENGITCPKCKFQYSLAKGGCMHFTCVECKFEFCSGCGQPFRQGTKCPVGPYCERLGLHAHHPRNCLFYLRDKDPPQLQQLLKENNVPFDTTPPEEAGGAVEEEGRRCQVPEQKEMPDGLIDDVCGRGVLMGYAGLCRLHYVEYLVEKINSHHLDPVIIFDEADLRVCLRRNGKAVPIRRWESEKLYRDKLIKLIKEQLPL